jgi:nucleoid-associated protein YgaU
VLIDEFVYQEQDGTRDVDATIYLAEYIPLDAVTTQTTASVNGDTENHSRRTEPETDTQEYTVVKGDCLSVICRRFYGYGTPNYYNAVARYNGIQNPHLIYPGQVLTLPPAAQLGVS